MVISDVISTNSLAKQSVIRTSNRPRRYAETPFAWRDFFLPCTRRYVVAMAI